MLASLAPVLAAGAAAKAGLLTPNGDACGPGQRSAGQGRCGEGRVHAHEQGAASEHRLPRGRALQPHRERLRPQRAAARLRPRQDAAPGKRRRTTRVGAVCEDKQIEVAPGAKFTPGPTKAAFQARRSAAARGNGCVLKSATGRNLLTRRKRSPSLGWYTEEPLSEVLGYSAKELAWKKRPPGALQRRPRSPPRPRRRNKRTSRVSSKES